MGNSETEIIPRTPRRILVIDDEQRMATSLRTLLETSGYEVDIAFSGREGISRLAEKDYPVVITDLRMADMDGFDVMEAVESRPGVAVIVITGHASADTAIEALRRRAWDYIPKPFDFDVLRAAVGKAFARVDADRFRDDMVSMITHDIKIPLSSILGYSSLIFDKTTGELSPRAREFVQTINSNGLKILTLIDNFLTSCKIDSGKLSIFRREVNISYLVEDLQSLFQVDLERNSLRLEVEIARNLPPIQGDETLIFRGLCNMFSNACKYTPKGGKVRIEARELDANASPLGVRSVEFSVSNTGPGIAAEEVEHVFDKFRRTGNQGSIEGSGVGLYVLRYVVEAHSGTVKVDSVPNELTTFSVYLPVEKPVKNSEDGAGI